MKDEKRAGMTKSERRLLITSIFIVVVLLALTFWWEDMNTNPVVSIPPKMLPNPNAYDYYDKAGNALLTSITLNNGKTVSVWDLGKEARYSIHLSSNYPAKKPKYYQADYKLLIRANAPALKKLRQGFAYEYADPSARFPNLNSPSYLSRMKRMADFLYSNAYIERQQSNWGTAMDDMLDAIHLGADIPHQAGLMAMLQGVAIEDMTRVDCWGFIDHLNAAQAHAAARRMEGILARHALFADILTEEKYICLSYLQELFRKQNWRKSCKQWSDKPDFLAIPELYFINKRAMMQNISDYFDALIHRAQQPYAAHPPVPPTPRDPLSQIMSPALLKARIKPLLNSTQDSLFTVTLALRAYYIEHGAYPAALQALVPSYLGKIPDDPFALHGPLRYRLTGKSYVLYSIGPDGIDHGGAPCAYGQGKKGKNGQPSVIDENSSGDIVAGVNVY